VRHQMIQEIVVTKTKGVPVVKPCALAKARRGPMDDRKCHLRQINLTQDISVDERQYCCPVRQRRHNAYPLMLCQALFGVVKALAAQLFHHFSLQDLQSQVR